MRGMRVCVGVWACGRAGAREGRRGGRPTCAAAAASAEAAAAALVSGDSGSCRPATAADALVAFARAVAASIGVEVAAAVLSKTFALHHTLRTSSADISRSEERR